MRTYDFSPLWRSTVGFDRLFDLAEMAQRAGEDNYPPYNIERLAEDRYQISLAVAGSIFTEMIFNYPGIGRLIFQSVGQRDFPMLQGCFFIQSCSVIIANLLVDILYQFLDPRIRY